MKVRSSLQGSSRACSVAIALILAGGSGCGSISAAGDGGGAGTGGGGAGTGGGGTTGGAGTSGVAGTTGAAGTIGGGGRGGTTGGAGTGGTGGRGGTTGGAGTGGTGGRGGTTGAAGTGGAGGRGGTTGGAGTGGAGTGGAGTGGAGTGGAGTGGAGGRGGTTGAAGTGGAGGRGGTTGSAGSGGAGAPCGAGMTCTGTQFCDWSSNRCGGLDATGSCQARPQGCTTIYAPVCACDGQVYASACDANAAGQDVSDSAGCTPPAGMFGCGHMFCAHGTQYCQATIGGAAGLPGSYACQPLPAACNGTPSCACLTGTMCGNCVVSAGGDAMTSCLVP